MWPRKLSFSPYQENNSDAYLSQSLLNMIVEVRD